MFYMFGKDLADAHRQELELKVRGAVLQREARQGRRSGRLLHIRRSR